MNDEIKRFEYNQVMRSYHEYFDIVAKGITIYILIIGACLTLPNTIGVKSGGFNLFREMCRFFAIFVSVVAITAYGASSVGFWTLHRRATQLASDLQLGSPTTWILPVSVWLACISGVFLMFLVGKYS